MAHRKGDKPPLLRSGALEVKVVNAKTGRVLKGPTAALNKRNMRSELVSEVHHGGVDPVGRRITRQTQKAMRIKARSK